MYWQLFNYQKMADQVDPDEQFIKHNYGKVSREELQPILSKGAKRFVELQRQRQLQRLATAASDQCSDS